MDSEKKKGSGEDPGGARFGNFINYYQFNPAEERISHLPEDLIRKLLPEDGRRILGLDVGCNAGNLTLALHRRYSTDNLKFNILGVDIDPILIQRATQAAANHFQTKNVISEKIKETEVETSDDTEDKSKNDHPEDSEIEEGNKISENQTNVNEEKLVDDEVKFCVVDIMSEDGLKCIKSHLTTLNTHKFDIIFLFSVSMWIHLHHGDSGLDKLLEICSGLSRYTLLEPQPWKCYQTAIRRMRKLGLPDFPKFMELKLRSDKLEPGILEIARKYGMEVVDNFGQTKWNRKLLLLKSDSHQLT